MDLWTRENIRNYTYNPEEENDKNIQKKCKKSERKYVN